MPKKEIKITNEYFGVILEDINSKFDVIKEGHLDLSEQIKKLDQKVDRNHKEFVEFRSETESNFKTVFELLSNIDDELKDIKSELADIKKTIHNKADLDIVFNLEKRVKVLEAEVMSLRAAV